MPLSLICRGKMVALWWWISIQTTSTAQTLMKQQWNRWQVNWYYSYSQHAHDDYTYQCNKVLRILNLRSHWALEAGDRSGPCWHREWLWWSRKVRFIMVTWYIVFSIYLLHDGMRSLHDINELKVACHNVTLTPVTWLHHGNTLWACTLFIMTYHFTNHEC